MLQDNHNWAVILAGGPASCEEMLQRAATIAPGDRICALLTPEPRRRGAGWSAIAAHNTIVQPRRRGTALEVLLALLHLERRDPHARVALLPSVCYAVTPERLGRGLRLAMSQLASSVDEIVHVEAGPRRAGEGLMLVARVESLLGLYERRFPEVVHALDWAVARDALDEGCAVAELYEQFPRIDLARHLLRDLEHHVRRIKVAQAASVAQQSAQALHAAL